MDEPLPITPDLISQVYLYPYLSSISSAQQCKPRKSCWRVLHYALVTMV